MLKTVELTETQVDGNGWVELEAQNPHKPLLEQLNDFLRENPGAQVISTALSDSVSGFFIKVRIRTMIVIYREADSR